MPTIKTSGGKVITKGGKPSCVCCNSWRVCADNTNEILDNSWDIYINDNLVGTYSGDVYENICVYFSESLLDLNGNNEVKFMRTNCVSDDYFQFQVLDPDDNVVYSDSLTGLSCPGADPPPISTQTFTFNLP